MNKKIALLSAIFCFFMNASHAICVKNETNSTLYYEIYNQNTGCPQPKTKFNSGTLLANAKQCHAHSTQNGNDWKIYRKDFIKVYQVNALTNKKELICDKNVNGILNTLRVDYTKGGKIWWCLDNSDN